MLSEDTIVAISTPPGRGGIGVVRLSGERARELGMSIVHLKAESSPSGKAPEPQRVHSGEFFDAETGATIDQILFTYFKAPLSYTGEDVVEVSAHGAPALLRHMVERLLSAGARLARPGEFTLRAFLNGKMDLAQAEAVADLIHSQTLYQARVAAQQLEGALSRRLKPTKERLLQLITLLEAGIDFADDDVPVASDEEILARIAGVRVELDELARSFATGRIVHEGLVLAIVGRPNVGKSSLFNRLVNEDRAIVTAQPGTTRDLVAETVQLGGIPLRFVDTAGLREAHDEAEQIGVRKSLAALADADLTLVVLDRSELLSEADARVIAQVARAAQRDGEAEPAAKRLLLVLNKCDLPARWGETELSRVISTSAGPSSAQAATGATVAVAIPTAAVSALTGAGIEELRNKILELTVPQLDFSAEPRFLTNARHKQCITNALEALDSAALATRHRVPHEMILMDLHRTLRALDEITGETTVEDILDRIFSQFCIGK